MQSAKELHEKFLAYEETIGDQLTKVETKKLTSEEGFKTVNQLLIEIKTLVGMQKLMRSGGTRS